MAYATQNPTAPAPTAAKSFAVTARESLESIVVAFALAFIFRAFIVEAFVIPTGSMAPTLYGQQIIHTCATCGYEYAHDVPPYALAGRPSDMRLKCPNCASERDTIPGDQVARPSSGDRILVHKWPFSVGGKLGPKRWDVTVFKDPHNGTVNYIKRMVGKPGEFVEIIHGDVYAAPLSVVREKEPGLIEEMDQLRRDLHQVATGKLVLNRRDMEARYQAINERLIPYLKIQRKAVDSPEAQKSLWFNVYSRDFLPNYAHLKSQPDSAVGWSPRIRSVEVLQPEQLDAGRIPAEVRRALEGKSWSLPEDSAVVVEKPGEEWRIAAPGGDLLIRKEENRLSIYEAAAWAAWDTSGVDIKFKSDSKRRFDIRFVGKRIEDFYGYNFNTLLPAVPVGDLRLAFTWFPEAGDGGLVLEMNRHKDRFAAHLQADGTVKIEHWGPDAVKPVLIGSSKRDPFRPGQAVTVEFQNVDFRVSLSIDGEEVVASTDQQYAPDLRELLSRNGEDPEQTIPSQVTIGGYGMRFRIAHLELDRDVYYRSTPISERESSPPQPDQPLAGYRRAQNPFYGWPGWGTQGYPIMLREGPINEYFMLGDNSPGSKDSRLWWEIGPHLRHLGDDYQLGTVPDDQLIGQAFFVYWPSGYRRSWTADVGIIPNFGRMRWIR